MIFNKILIFWLKFIYGLYKIVTYLFCLDNIKIILKSIHKSYYLLMSSDELGSENENYDSIQKDSLWRDEHKMEESA